MKYDILKLKQESENDEIHLNWVEYLPVYQIIYNTGFHKSIGGNVCRCRLTYLGSCSMASCIIYYMLHTDCDK